MAHQSLYRRYRPRRFDEVRGQDHVIAALRNAVRNESEGHAYLFSGPRGTGKTSTARILAKALNCENLQNGEPCCECTPCVDMEAGRSFDLFELDAASNNGVDAVRDLIERTAVGSPGRTKVYILDEVHMLSPGASNALLKTLEEPPDHVRFVLATTDPQKVLPTIRSRTQHFEFQLLSAQELERQVRWIVADAGLDVDDAAIAWVVQKGRGSSRDTLSALDQVVAAGGVVERAEPVERLYEALVARDTGQAVLAVADALAQGHDPRVLGAAFLDSLRDAFLVSLGVEVPHLMEADQERYGRWAAELGTPALTRAMEAVGSALVDMRQAADPRVPLEVALVRLTSAHDTSVAGLIERIERIEQAMASGSVPAASPAAPRAEPAAADRASTADSGAAGGGPAQARAELARLRAARTGGEPEPGSNGTPRPRTSRPAPPPVPGATPRESAAPVPSDPPVAPPPEPPTAATPPPTRSAEPAAPTAAPAGAADEPAAPAPSSGPPGSSKAPPPQDGPAAGGDASPSGAASAPPAAVVPSSSHGSAELTVSVVDAALQAVLPQLRAPAKAACQGGAFVGVDGAQATFELALGVPVRHAERFKADIEAALREHLGQPLVLQIVPAGVTEDAPRISGGAIDLVEPEADEELTIDIAELEDAHDVAETGIDRLTKAFPGAVVLDKDEVDP